MSLRLKVILGIGAILFLVIFVYAIIGLPSRANPLLTIARREADLITAVRERAIALAMERRQSDQVQSILERIAESPDLAGIRIVDPARVVRRSTIPGEMGRSVPERDRPSDATVPGAVYDFRERTLGVYRRIPNGPTCFGCHARERPPLGSLNVRFSFPAIDSLMAQQGTFMILSTIGGLLAAGGLIALLFTFVVGRRLEALARTMSLVEAGDLSARVAEGQRDELGRLASSFNAMVARLADARRQLEDRHAGEIRRAQNLASLGKLAAGIAHEINNPIAGVQNCVRTLLRGAKNEGQRVQYLQMLREGLERVGRIVGQLLHFARETKPQFARTHVPPILRRCVSLLEHELSARRITCTLPPDGDLPPLLADPHQLEPVFLNLLMNAVVAMPGGGASRSTPPRARRRWTGFSRSAWPTRGWASPPGTCRGSSTRSSPRRRWARARAWASR